MQRLTIDEIRQTVTRAPPRPPQTFAATEESVGPYTCRVCLEHQFGIMLFHETCQVPFCAVCILQHIDQSKPCPMCRAPLKNAGQQTFVARPNLRDNYWLDLIKFRCGPCGIILSAPEAHHHRAKCEGENRHVPPPHIRPWHQNPQTANELISNPPPGPEQQTARTNSRLIVFHFNGRQVLSRQIPPNRTIRQVKEVLNRIVNVDIGTIKIYRFVHRELRDETPLGDVALRGGVTHFAAFTNMPPLGDRCLNLVLQDVGPHRSNREPDDESTGDWDAGVQFPLEPIQPPPPDHPMSQEERRREARWRRRQNRLERPDEERAAFLAAIQEQFARHDEIRANQENSRPNQ